MGMMRNLSRALFAAFVFRTVSSTPAETPRYYPDLTSLAYVTPWNSRGNEVVETYRHKLDMVSPVWYTVHATTGEPNAPYVVRGGPTSKGDEDWYRRLQQPGISPDGSQKRIEIVPRFMLDGWTENDYRALLFNETRWNLLADAIVHVVDKMSYDGVVFESGLTHMLSAPLTTLSAMLHAQGKGRPKLLCIVLPPVRTPGALEGDKTAVRQFGQHNQAILGAVETLAKVADYFSVMTYDMTGPGGMESKLARDHGFVGDRTLREPGENTNKEWIYENMVAFAETSGASTLGSAEEDDDLAALVYEVDEPQQRQLKPQIALKLLMGYPMYGYQFPILYMDQKTGKLSGERKQGTYTTVIRGAGEAITARDAVDLKPDFGAGHVSEMLGSGEQCFEYTREGHDGWWLACHPTRKGIDEALNTMYDALNTYGKALRGSGIALWEIGQAVPDLLDGL